MTTMTSMLSTVAAAALGLGLVASGPGARAAEAITLEAASGEAFEAAGESLDIFLADASAILLGRGAAVRIDEYRFDAATGAGVLRLTILRGAVRVSGGLLNDIAAIEIATPHATLSLEGGAALVIVDDRRTRAHLLNGQRLTVTAGGVTRELTRPEFAVSVFGGAPSAPARLSAEQLAADFEALASGLAGAPAADDAPILLAALTTDDLQNRSADVTPDAPGSAPIVPGADLSFDIAGTFSTAGSFTLDPGDSAPSVSGGASTASTFGTGVAIPGINDKNGSHTKGRQDLSLAEFEIVQENAEFDRKFYLPRNAGPTTNKVYGNASLDGAFTMEDTLRPIRPEQGGIVYVYGEGPDFTDPEDPTSPRLGGNSGAVFGLDLPDRFDTEERELSHNRGRIVEGFSSTEEYSDSSAWKETWTLLNLGLSIDVMFVHCCRNDLPSDANIAGARWDGDEVFNHLLAAEGPSNFVFGSDVDFSFLGVDVVGLSAGMGDVFQKNPTYSDGRSGNNFVYFEIDGDDGEGRLVFAAGDLDEVDANSPPGLSVDAFEVRPGLKGESRSFLRHNTWSDMNAGTGQDARLSSADLTDTGLLIVNPDTLNGEDTGDSDIRFESGALHVDFGLSHAGDGQQVSTISATLGEVRYRSSREALLIPSFKDFDEDGRVGELELFGVDLDLDQRQGEYESVFEPEEVTAIDAITTARTIGSSNDGRGGSVSLQGPVMSTSAGGGNSEVPGRMGYFVLENAGAVWDDVRFPENNGSYALPGGTERPIGTGDETRFAIARLGIGTGTEPLSPGGRGAARAEGFATGLVEVPGAGGIEIAPFASFSPAANVNIDEIAGDATTLRITMSGTDGRAQTVFELGGDGASAYIDRDRYGARSPDGAGAAVAAISGNLVAGEFADGGFLTSAGAPIAGDGLDYEHLKWGFFFGDLVAAGPQASHVHLGSFAAGPPIDAGDLSAATGTAIYAGHALGEVLDAGRRRVSLGTFEERFDFASRTGETRLDFDRRLYTGGSALQGGAYASSVSASGGFGGELAGRFTGPVSGGQPGGLVGQFRLTNGVDDPAAAYRAVGTFAGEKR